MPSLNDLSLSLCLCCSTNDRIHSACHHRPRAQWSPRSIRTQQRQRQTWGGMYATPSGSTTLHATTGAWVLGHAVRLYSTAHWMLMSTLDLCLYAVAQRTACIGNPQSASFLRFRLPYTAGKEGNLQLWWKKTCSFLPGLYVLFSVHWTYIAEPMMSVNASYKTPLYKLFSACTCIHIY